MNNIPHFKSMNRVGGAPLDDKHMVLLFDNIESIGKIQYAYLLAVIDNASKEPALFVSSEVNNMAANLGGGSHFLCVFEGSLHTNLGHSDDWGDPKKFFPRALQIAQEHFGVKPA